MADLSQTRGLCFDIDDTFSTHGKITSEAFAALWALKNAGIKLIPVTGRPAGWCDHIARFWPVDAVIGENGAFSMYMSKGKLNRLDTLPASASIEAKQKLAQLKIDILKHFPSAEFASDQAYREYDLAIDFCEDVTPWSAQAIDSLIHFCQSRGAIAKISSIHVNTWFGRYTKIEGFQKLLSVLSVELALPPQDKFVFVGDSPNDEPMFERFKKSVGVQNIQPFLTQLHHPPTWITHHPQGAGFAELAQKILSQIPSPLPRY